MSASFPRPATSSPTFIPTLIALGQTYNVEAESQVLFASDIDIEGDLVIDGELVEVD